MKPLLRRGASLAALLAVAAACSFFAYRALVVRTRGPDAWSRAIALARKAERTKGVVPALQIRAQAVTLFDDLAKSGPPSSRSHGRLLAGLLQIRNASAQPDPSQSLALAVKELQSAVRLDRGNDDAAYDLELLLSRSVQVGRPIGQPRAEKKKSPAGRPGMAPPGTGY